MPHDQVTSVSPETPRNPIIHPPCRGTRAPRPREIALSPAASSSRPGAGPASPGDLVGGRGWFPAWEQTRSRPFTSTPGGAPAPVAVPSAAPHGRLGEQLPPLPHESDRAVGAAGVLLLFCGLRWARCPHHRCSHLPGRLQARPGAGKEEEEEGAVKGDVEGALYPAPADGLEPWHLRRQLPHPGQRRSGALRTGPASGRIRR